jgi:hypothetical protein
MMHPANPYRLTPVDNPKLLRTRRGAIRMALEAVAPADGGCGHAVVCGTPRTGRTSTIKEVARRAEAERDSLIVRLRLFDEDLSSSGLIRALLVAAIEQLAALHDGEPDWYRAWSSRVLLRDQSPMGVNDVFISALAFAADPLTALDPAVLERDLRTLGRLGREIGRTRMLVLIDNADPLLEDAVLVERLFGALEAAGGFSVLIACRYAGLNHLVEAVSPCLRGCKVVPLAPFWAPGVIRVCLTGPLDAGEAERLMPAEDELGLLLDLMQLSNGNPFDVALIAGQLWEACEAGEQEYYELTPRVLERVLPMLTMHTGAREGLHDGAQAARRLQPDRLESAVRFAALSKLTIAQIAVARAVGLPQRVSGAIGNSLDSCDLEKEQQRVRADLDRLASEGVIELADDGEHFQVRGGRYAALTLKHQARALLGAKAADVPFEMPFLVTVGQPVAREWVTAARERITGAGELAWQPIFNPTSTGTGTRVHAALNTQRFDNVDLEMIPTYDDAEKRLLACLTAPDEHAIALVELTIAADGNDLALVEMWDVPPMTTTHDVNEALSYVSDRWQPRIRKAGISWRSSQAVVLTGDLARRSLIQLVSSAAGAAVVSLFRRWHDGEDEHGLDRSLELADTAVRALREQRVPDWERGAELSDMLSRRGFLLSLFDERIDEAANDLAQASERGPGNGWVTDWNLANVALRRGERDRAEEHFAKVQKAIDGDADTAIALFHVPGRSARESVIVPTKSAMTALLPLQRAVGDSALADGTKEQLAAALEPCREHEDEVVRTVAGWVTAAIEGGMLGSPQRTAN